MKNTICARGVMSDVSNRWFFRLSQREMVLESTGDIIGRRSFPGHQRRKSNVCDGTACNSICTQSGFSMQV